MPPRGNANARAKAKAKCKAKGKARGRGAAKALAKARARQLAWNSRRQQRREVILELNALCDDVAADRLKLQVKTKEHEHAKPEEVELHETAVAWMRHRLARSVPAKPWEETREQYSSRLKQVVAEINETLDVEGLCRALPKRIEDLVATRGDRLSY